MRCDIVVMRVERNTNSTTCHLIKHPHHLSYSYCGLRSLTNSSTKSQKSLQAEALACCLNSFTFSTRQFQDCTVLSTTAPSFVTWKPSTRWNSSMGSLQDSNAVGEGCRRGAGGGGTQRGDVLPHEVSQLPRLTSHEDSYYTLPICRT
jgi:hypothetical protein